MTYSSRTPGTGVPSGGQLSKPIVGQGKLGVGRHRLSVLSARKVRGGHWDVILADAGNHCHLEAVADWPLDLTQGEIEAEITLGPGYAVARDGGVYYGVDTGTRAQVTDRHPSVQAVYDQASADGRLPCTTQLKAYRRVKPAGDWVEVRVVDPAIHSTKTSGPQAVPPPGDAASPQPGTAGTPAGASQASGSERTDPPGLRNNRAGRRRSESVRRRRGPG
jgi:hypothetical protein